MCFAVLNSFGHSNVTVPNKAAVPVALTGVQIAGEYLIAAGAWSYGRPVASARTGRHGGVRRVMCQGRIERRVGFFVATRGRLRCTWCELAAPIVGFDGREHGKELVRSMLGLDRCDRRVEAAFAKPLVAGKIAALPRLKRLKEFAIGTDHGGPQNEFTKQKRLVGLGPSDLLSLFHPRLTYTHINGRITSCMEVGVKERKKRECCFLLCFLHFFFHASFSFLHPLSPSRRQLLSLSPTPSPP